MQTNTLLALDADEISALILHHAQALCSLTNDAAAERHRKRIEQLEDALTPAHLRVRAA